MKARIRYCGCCNPRTDLERLGHTLRERLAALGFSLADGGESEPDVVVILNGCETACGERWTAVQSRAKMVLAGVRCELWRRDGHTWQLVVSSRNGYEGVLDELRTASG